MSGRPVGRTERLLYAASTAMVLTVAGGAILLDATAPDDPHPRAVASPDGIPWDDDSGRAVPWRVENPSSWDIEGVQIAVSLGDTTVTQEVDYLPRGARRHGTAILPPAAGEVPRIVVTGYRLP